MTRSRLLLATVATTALLAAGCGAQGTAVESGQDTAAPPAAGACLEGATECDDMGGDMGAPPPDTPITDGGAGGGVDGDPGETQAEEVEPTDGLDDLREVGWDHVEVDPDDQTRLTVSWWSGVAPCNVLSEVQVETTDEAVILTVVEGTEPADEPQACIEIAQYKQTTVTLDEELGPRSILDGTEG